MSFLTLYVTYPNEETARKVVDVLIEEKRIACANTFPIQSAYWWKGQIMREGEVVSLMKTIPEAWDSLYRRIEVLHPYEVPCIERIEVSANPAFEAWVRDSVENWD